ncbi:hypothetical protein [Enterococcus mundtii]|uniref:hypothetical protein n=1 Tax=Enterococcus mundtii TaxID=53346 RepID=UPI0015F14D21|nr:hypothetical protein [Enterococcus mundtii]
MIEASRKIQSDAQNAVKGLYEDEAQTIVKKTLLQTDIDNAREKSMRYQMEKKRPLY